MRTRLVMTVAALVAMVTVFVPSASAVDSSSAARTGHCPERVNVTVFRDGGPPLLDWRENLEFDGRGMLWVSHSVRNRVEGYTSDGKLAATFPVSGPGGIRRGPDGMMYVNFGVSPLATTGGVMRFDPAAARPQAEKVVTGTPGINGLAIDDNGNFYLSRELATGVLKVRPDGTRDEEWTRKANVFGTNGLEIVGDQLYASVITSTRSPVVRIPLDDPAGHTTVAVLSGGLLDAKLLDDLAYFNGDLMVTSFRHGELVRVAPGTGRACVLASGLRMPTSVRVARGFGEYRADRDLSVTEASGRIVRVAVG
ncbi:hypothetical protein H3146_07630 [Streptomyces sp. OF3]|uniref:SMP-30/Gluconolactonase/LRE-like region domain-containing protein n=1 Tax=Streptomyces alkaliterrae TaxID=2213162 RepID=A0A7W3ZM73_9ACTN|nr:hypothetical protein [Streptomyces alkaliterrae]MBB1253240.1 hypothetical protein [Streptomyces alkaliterrae]